MKNWTIHDMPPQQGRVAVVTGATGGLGFETALALAGAGADVVLTGLIANGPGERGLSHLLNRLTIRPLASHSAADGALPTLFAATAADARPGAYYGPNGWFELKGAVGVAQISKGALDEAVAARLWDVSEALTQAQWPRNTTERAA